MQDFAREPYIPTKSEIVCFYLKSITTNVGRGFDIHYGQSPHPNTVKMLVRCHFVVNDEVKKQLLDKFEKANASLLESVELMFGFDWLKLDVVIEQHPEIKTQKESLLAPELPKV